MTDNNEAEGFYSAFPERRINPFRPELRAGQGEDSSHIVGYASVFNKLSRRLGGFVEQVNPGAFRSSQAEGWPDTVCRFNHSDDWLLGTIRGSTLQLTTDDTGLFYDVVPPSFRSDILELMRRGDVGSSSFAFRTPEGGDDWGLSSFNFPLRTLLSVELVDVAPVVTPAYPDASSAVRSMEGAVESLARRFSADPTEIRTLLDHNQGVKLFKRSDRPSINGLPVQAPINEEPDMSKDDEARKKLTSKERSDLPDSSFGYVDEDGVGHFPIQDAAHVRNALARIAQGAQYGKQALPKVKAAAKKFGIDSDEQNNIGQLSAELRDVELGAWFITTPAEETEEERAAAAQAAADKAAKSKASKPKPKADSTAKDAAATESDDEESDEDDEDESGKGVEGEERDADSEDEARASKKAAKVPAKAKGKNADSDSDDDEDDEDDEDDSDADDSKEKPTSGKPAKVGDNDKSDKVGKGLPPWLAKQKRMQMDLMEKRYDPFAFDDED